MMRGVISGGPGAIAWGWAYGLPPTIWTTTDGRAWDPATVEMPTEPDPENPGTISGITAGGPGYVAVGWYDMVGEGRRGLVWTSVDGRTWDLVPHDAAFDHAIIDDVVAWRGELLAYGEEEAGSDEGAGRPLLWTSGDGLAWQREALSTPDGFRASDVVPSREQLWAFGLPASYDINAGWRQTRWLTSTDGRTWSASSLPRYPGPLYPLRDRFLTILQPFPTSGDSAPPDAADRPAPGLYRSTDGSSWERLSQGVSSIEGYDLIEVGGTLVIVGDDGPADPECLSDCRQTRPLGWRSLDGGVTWRAVPADAAEGTMTFVAALPDGTLVSVGRLLDDRGSPSPAAWVSKPPVRPTATPVVTPAAGSGAQLGDSWVAAQMPVVVGRPVGRIEAVTAGGPGFVAVGRGCVNTGADLPTCEGVVWTTTDGKAWHRTPAGDPTDTGAVFNPSGPEIGMFDVAAGGPGIVAIGYAARPDMAATIWFSSDNGASWERAKIGDVGSTRVNAIAWDGRQFVMVGEDRSQWDGTLAGMDKASARAAVWTSTDGYSFTRVPHSEIFDVGEFIDTMEDPSTGGMNDVVAGPAGLVAVGSVCTAEPGGCKAAAWTSADGSSWEREVAMRAPGDVAFSSGLNGVAASDSGYIAVSDDTVLMSADGRSWERRAQMGRLSEVVTIGKRFFGTVQGDGWEEIAVFDSEGKLSFVDVGDPLPGSVYNPAEWHLAATPGIAVAVGPEVETDDPMAMVSVGK